MFQRLLCRNFETRIIFCGYHLRRIFRSLSQNCVFSCYFWLIFNCVYIGKEWVLPETITHCKIQNVSKIKNFEISRPVEYSMCMIWQNIRQIFQKLRIFMLFLTHLNKNKNFQKIYLFNPPCPPYAARHKARKSKSMRKVILLHLFNSVCKVWFVGPPSMKKPFWDRQE